MLTFKDDNCRQKCFFTCIEANCGSCVYILYVYIYFLYTFFLIEAQEYLFFELKHPFLYSLERKKNIICYLMRDIVMLKVEKEEEFPFFSCFCNVAQRSIYSLYNKDTKYFRQTCHILSSMFYVVPSELHTHNS